MSRTNDQVAHLWANQSKPEARNGQGNFFFRDTTIYSYAEHFPVARIVTNKKGERAVLFTDREYSVTTAGHKAIARSACSHLPVFTVPDRVVRGHVGLASSVDEWRADAIKADHKAAIDFYRESILDQAKAFAKARTRKPYILGLIEAKVAEAAAYAKFFNLPKRDRLKPFNVETMAAEAAEEAKKHAAKEKARAKQARENAVKDLALWLAYQPAEHGTHTYQLPVSLRLKQGDPETIETTKGAEFPTEHGRKAFRALARIRRDGATWHRNGQTIRCGHFQVDSVAEDGTVKAGCHAIAWSEIERFASLMGWPLEATAEDAEAAKTAEA